MKLNKHALHLACLAALGSMGSAHAVQVAGDLLEVYGNFYPQYQITSFGDASTAPLSTMTAGKNNPGVGTGAGKDPASLSQVNWVNSYLGFKGQKAFGDIKAGYDFQGVVMKNGSLATETDSIGEARDAFVFIQHAKAGTLQIGQMDTVYKEFGDRVRMLGISSGNFVSTSGMVSGVGWKSAVKVAGISSLGVVTAPAETIGTAAAGTTSFNTRINGQIRWISPNWNGVEVGVSLRPDATKTATSDGSLSAMGIRWSNATYYVGLAQEIHNDYRTMSGTGTTAATNTTVYSITPRSKDTGTRLSVGYTAGPLRLAADMATLKYTEDATVVGKFTSYETSTWQVSGEYAVTPQVTVAANYAKGNEGSCTILGGGNCTTSGLGGSLISLGARYDYDKNIGLFALFGVTTPGDAATYGSGNLASAIGGKTTNMAIGIQVKF